MNRVRWIHDIRAVLPARDDAEERDDSAVDTIVLHCTAMPDWNVWETARYHTGPNHISPEGCPTIAYAYFIEQDGLVYRCLSHSVRSWHVGSWNDRAIGVCLAYDAGDDPPPREQLAAAVDVCAALVLELGLTPDRVMGHRELEGTGYVVEDGETVQRKECPGMAIDMDAFRRAVARALERPGEHRVEVV
ncbi:MAG: peptidoglycan recognition family protein [Candidatus Eisenbacteria bacterium]